jgi:predicted  nucleic acid-binding Zn-ribbon protein
VLDSPLLSRLIEARRGGAPPAEVEDLKRRLASLEDEMDDLGQAVRGLKDETQFLQRLIESAEERSKLPPAT